MTNGHYLLEPRVVTKERPSGHQSLIPNGAPWAITIHELLVTNRHETLMSHSSKLPVDNKLMLIPIGLPHSGGPEKAKIWVYSSERRC